MGAPWTTGGNRRNATGGSANCNVLTGAGNKEPEYFLDIELTSSDLAYSIPHEHIAPIAHPQIVDEKKIKALIEADKTIKRTEANERRPNRVHMLVKAVGKALRVNSLELVQAAKQSTYGELRG